MYRDISFLHEIYEIIFGVGFSITQIILLSLFYFVFEQSKALSVGIAIFDFAICLFYFIFVVIQRIQIHHAQKQQEEEESLLDGINLNHSLHPPSPPISPPPTPPTSPHSSNKHQNHHQHHHRGHHHHQDFEYVLFIPIIFCMIPYCVLICAWLVKWYSYDYDPFIVADGFGYCFFIMYWGIDLTQMRWHAIGSADHKPFPHSSAEEYQEITELSLECSPQTLKSGNPAELNPEISGSPLYKDKLSIYTYYESRAWKSFLKRIVIFLLFLVINGIVITNIVRLEIFHHHDDDSASQMTLPRSLFQRLLSNGDSNNDDHSISNFDVLDYILLASGKTFSPL